MAQNAKQLVAAQGLEGVVEVIQVCMAEVCEVLILAGLKPGEYGGGAGPGGGGGGNPGGRLNFVLETFLVDVQVGECGAAIWWKVKSGKQELEGVVEVIHVRVDFDFWPRKWGPGDGCVLGCGRK